MELCPALGITIPVGKDSLSMSTVWREAGREKRVTAPVSLIVSAFAHCADVRRTLTPQLRPVADSVLLLIDLGRGKNRLGGSILAQVYSQMGAETPDVDSAADLKNYWNAIQQLGHERKILAYHDRSDGGLLACAVEMAFAGHTGVELALGGPGSREAAFAHLFAEELGAIIQIRQADLPTVNATLKSHGLNTCTAPIGTLNPSHRFVIRQGPDVLLDEDLFALRAIWSDVTRRMQAMRDNPAGAEQEFQLKLDCANPGIRPKLTFKPSAFNVQRSAVLPKVAILREQGVNSHIEMAHAFTRAGFRAIDVHMTDILSGRISLKNFRGLAACGGFSYGDVLGAGEGWAKSILFNERARAEFAAYFARPDNFSLGVCNGCQMMSNLKSIIPGTTHWPRFVQNQSERYEGRFVSVRIEKSPSVLFAGMEGSVIPIVTAHGEGYAEFPNEVAARRCSESGFVAARFVDNQHEPTEYYPLNPNGSPLGMTAFTSADGRATIMMPHPERVHRTVSLSWHPPDWGEDSPWMQLFYNARTWVG
jgi:phosphoribosylformylglycinamidine synthase